MAEESTILLDKKLIEKLKKAREYSKQTYNELLEKMVKKHLFHLKEDKKHLSKKN